MATAHALRRQRLNTPHPDDASRDPDASASMDLPDYDDPSLLRVIASNPMVLAIRDRVYRLFSDPRLTYRGSQATDASRQARAYWDVLRSRIYLAFVLVFCVGGILQMIYLMATNVARRNEPTNTAILVILTAMLPFALFNASRTLQKAFFVTQLLFTIFSSVALGIVGIQASMLAIAIFVAGISAGTLFATYYAVAVSAVASMVYWFEVSGVIVITHPLTAAVPLVSRGSFLFLFVQQVTIVLILVTLTNFMIKAGVSFVQRLSNESFRFVESGNVFIFQVDTDGVVTAWNAAAERLSGYSKSEAVGRPFVSFVAGDTSHLALVVTSRVDNFNTKDVGFTLRTHDGRLVRMTVNVMPRYNLVGNVVGNVGVAMDITDRHRMNMELEASKVFLQSIVDAVSTPLAVVSDGMVVLSANPAFDFLVRDGSASDDSGEDFGGGDAGDAFDGTGDRSGSSPGDSPRATASVASGASGERSLLNAVAAIDDEAGSLAAVVERAFLAVCGDVWETPSPRSITPPTGSKLGAGLSPGLMASDRRRWNRNLPRSGSGASLKPRLWRSTSLNSDEYGSGSLTPDTEITFSDEVSVGSRLFRVWARRLDAGGTGTGAPLLEGRAEAVLFSIVDMTEDSGALGAFFEAKKVEASHRAKSELLVQVSAELRNPLAGILGMNRFLRQTMLSVEQRDCVDYIELSAQILRSMTNEVNRLATGDDASTAEDAGRAFDVRRVVERVASMSLFFLQGPLMNAVVSHLPPRQNTAVVGDSERLTQILYSLVAQVMTYLGKGGSVAITASAIDETAAGIEFRFEVTGRGLAGVPELFGCAGGQAMWVTSEIGLADLGLAIVGSAVQRMGGTLMARNLGDEFGFAFTVSLAKRPRDVVDLRSFDLTNRSVVVCDPSLVLAETLADYVREAGGTAFATNRIGLAVNHVVANSVDAVVACDSFVDDVAMMQGVADCGVVLLSCARRAMSTASVAGLSTSSASPSPSPLDLASDAADPCDGSSYSGFDPFDAGPSSPPSSPSLSGLPAPLDTTTITKPVAAGEFFAALYRVLGKGKVPAVSGVLSEAPTPPPGPVAPAQQLTVLVVEDNFVNRNVVSRALVNMGYICELASNGREAVDRFEAGGNDAFDRIAVTLMDANMPVMNGFEATGLIRELEADLGRTTRHPIVALTAYVTENQRLRCLESGMDLVMAKPVTFVDLEATINDVLGNGGDDGNDDNVDDYGPQRLRRLRSGQQDQRRCQRLLAAYFRPV